MNNKNIFFIGFMGSGKTTVSAAFGKAYNRPVLELDDEIVARDGRSVRQMFEESGEEYFRDWESRMLREITAGNGTIVSCGGGIVIREENIRVMKQNGFIVLLKATPETTLERVKNEKTRPILNGHMNVEYIEQLMNKRASAYQAAADVVVVTDGKSVEQVVRDVYESIHRAGQPSV